MKKFISIALSAVMLISAGAISAMPVMAAGVSSPGSSEVTTKPAVDTEPVIITVNSEKSSDVTYTKEDYKYTFSYSGKGEVIDWEFPNMVEGVDYSVLSMSDDNSKIVFVNDGSRDSTWDIIKDLAQMNIMGHFAAVNRS